MSSNSCKEGMLCNYTCNSSLWCKVGDLKCTSECCIKVGEYISYLYLFLELETLYTKLNRYIYIGIICCAVLVGDLKGPYCFETLEIVLLRILP